MHARRSGLRAVALAALIAATAHADSWRDSTTPTGWWYFTRATDAQINAKIDEGYRLVKIDVVDSDPMRFAAVLVSNAGEYANPGVGWWYDDTYASLEARLQTPGVRALQIHPYLNASGQLRYATVLAGNSGLHQIGWWWAHNTDAAGIQTIRQQYNMRLVSCDRRPNEGARFSAVFVSNTGGNQRNWWHYPGVSAGTISNLLNQHNARITDLKYIGGGQFDAILEASQGQRWWWYYGVTSSQLSVLLGNREARLYGFQHMGDGPDGPIYAALMLNNANALETRISSIMRGIMGDEIYVPIGASLKRVHGSYRAGIHHQRVFDPASTIKVLHHVHAMRAVALGDLDLTSPIVVRGIGGDGGGCPPEMPIGAQQLSTVLRTMMEDSNNVSTEAIKDHFGQDELNQTALDLGMADTQLNRRLGCGGPHNMLTLDDAGRLHEAVVDGYLGSFRDEFYDLMIDESDFNIRNWGGAAGYPDVDDITQEEAADIGLPEQKRQDFLNAIDFAFKPGSVGLNGVRHISNFGWISIPFRTNGVLTPREFVVGVFVDGTAVTQNGDDATTAAIGEILRDELRAAMLTWITPATLQLTSASDFTMTGPQGGPFEPNSRTYFLSNVGDTTMSWTATDNCSWARILPSAGSLPPGSQAMVTIYQDDPIHALLPGTYNATATFTNTTSGLGNTTRAIQVIVTQPPGGSIPGDTDGDCDVDLTDLATLLGNFGRLRGATLADGDVDGDGDVDLTDLATLLGNFGSRC